MKKVLLTLALLGVTAMRVCSADTEHDHKHRDKAHAKHLDKHDGKHDKHHDHAKGEPTYSMGLLMESKGGAPKITVTPATDAPFYPGVLGGDEAPVPTEYSTGLLLPPAMTPEEMVIAQATQAPELAGAVGVEGIPSADNSWGGVWRGIKKAGSIAGQVAVAAANPIGSPGYAVRH